MIMILVRNMLMICALDLSQYPMNWKVLNGPWINLYLFTSIRNLEWWHYIFNSNLKIHLIPATEVAMCLKGVSIATLAVCNYTRWQASLSSIVGIRRQGRSEVLWLQLAGYSSNLCPSVSARSRSKWYLYGYIAAERNFFAYCLI